MKHNPRYNYKLTELPFGFHTQRFGKQIQTSHTEHYVKSRAEPSPYVNHGSNSYHKLTDIFRGFLFILIGAVLAVALLQTLPCKPDTQGEKYATSRLPNCGPGSTLISTSNGGEAFYNAAAIREILRQEMVAAMAKSVPEDRSVQLVEVAEGAVGLHTAGTIADYALLSSGAEVLEATADTETYGDTLLKINLLGWASLTVPYPWSVTLDHPKGPAMILQPSTQPGECWSMTGSSGTVRIKLSHLITITAVSLEHITVSQSPEGNIDSAPRVFHISGLEPGAGDWIKRQLGTFEYNKNGSPVQVFQVVESKRSYPHQVIELNVASNHGNRDYTCVYKLRVHGQLAN